MKGEINKRPQKLFFLTLERFLTEAKNAHPQQNTRFREFHVILRRRKKRRSTVKHTTLWPARGGAGTVQRGFPRLFVTLRALDLSGSEEHKATYPPRFG